MVDWLGLLQWMALSTGVGLGIFHGVAGYFHLRYYVRRADDREAWKCQPTRTLPAHLQRRAIRLSNFNLVVAGVLTGFLLHAIEHGLPVPIYYAVADYGWLYTLGSTVVLFVLVDWIAYWVHRALHHELLYKKFHRTHHAYVATTPYVTAAIHPLVFLTLQITTFSPISLIPFHAVSIAAVFIYVLVYNIMGHSGVVLRSRFPWQAASTYHDDHHAHFHVNFGQHLILWDRLHGTLRKQGRTYGVEVFGGRGQAAAGSATAREEFVRY